MKLDHILVVLAALALVLGVYLAADIVHGANPKLLDGVLILVGAIAGLARSNQ